MPPRKPVVVILSVEEFALLEARAAAAQADPYLHARELLLRSIRPEPAPTTTDRPTARARPM